MAGEGREEGGKEEGALRKEAKDGEYHDLEEEGFFSERISRSVERN